MSVLKNERRTSVHQFKINYFGIKADIDIIIGKISNRRKRFIPIIMSISAFIPK